MKGQKKSKVAHLEKKVERLNTMVFGIMETIKRMPDYNEAIEKFKKEHEKINPSN
jgi:hypothetical protein